MVISGATGTGKTELAIQVALALRAEGIAAEVVNADALQVYRGMDIGTAKPTVAERRGVPHRCFDLWAVHEIASVAAYRDAARAAIDDIRARGAVPLLVGGSGLYLEAVQRELAIPATDLQVRAAIESRADRIGAVALWNELQARDAAAAAKIPAGNVRRVVRALEVIELTGAPYAASLPESAPRWSPAVRFVTELPNDLLEQRLRARAAHMWANGLVEETRALLGVGLREGRTASKAVGYAEAIAVLDGELTAEAGLEQTALRTRRLVRRQRAWFRRDTDAVVLDARDPSAVATVVAAARFG